MRESAYATEEVTLSGKKNRFMTALWRMRIYATEEAIFKKKRIFQVKGQSL